jgi:ArsR family transcriptional regulator, arsenate/arsenite/antimonite-responsive transcriptional repressor
MKKSLTLTLIDEEVNSSLNNLWEIAYLLADIRRIDNLCRIRFNYKRNCAHGGIKMRNLVKALKALSDDTRIRIINLLLVRECCVCEVMQALEISPTRASRNLNMLYDAGFLKLKKEGLWSLYSLDKKEIPGYLGKMVKAIELALASNETALEDRERLKSASRAGSVCLPVADRTCGKGLSV